MYLTKLVYIILILQTSVVCGQFISRDQKMQRLVISNVSSKALVDYLNSNNFESIKDYHLENFFLPKDYFYEVYFTNINQRIGTYDLFSFRGLDSFVKELDNVDSALVEAGMHYVIHHSFNHYVNKQPYDIGIIGVDSVNHDVLFISGYMFLDDIKDKYFESGINDVSRQEYIKLRYFNYKPIIEKVTRRYITFYSPMTRRKYRVILKKNLLGNCVERITKISEPEPIFDY